MKDRTRYLKGLAEDYGIPPEVVFMMADVLGPNEDYDGLIVALEDWEYMTNADFVATKIFDVS